MRTQTYHYTCIGGRNYNQDSLWYSEDTNNGLWIVADGLGGHHHSEMASSLIIRTIEEAWEQNPEMELGTLLLQCHEKILQLQNEHPEAENAASTVVLLRRLGEKMAVAHAGDSRLYYFRNSHLLFRTKDHSIAQMNVTLGEITEKEQRTSPDRNKLYNVLGGDKTPKPEVRETFNAQPGDAFLLCTDGFWEYLSETEMLVDLLKAPSAKAWAEHMLVRIKKRQPEGNDNYSLICGVVV